MSEVQKKVFDVEVENALRKLIQSIKTRLGNPADLTVDEKTSFVAALNAVNAKVTLINQAVENAVAINDEEAGAATVWSGNKVQAAINAAVASIVNGAGEDGDTLSELAAKITAVAQANAGLLNLDEAQELTQEQKAQARATLGKSVLIVDEEKSADTTYSSNKIEELITAKVQEATTAATQAVDSAKDELETSIDDKVGTAVTQAKAELGEQIEEAKAAAQAAAEAATTSKDFVAIVEEEWNK